MKSRALFEWVLLAGLSLPGAYCRADFVVKVSGVVTDFDTSSVRVRLESGRTAVVNRKAVRAKGPLRPGQKVEANVPLDLIGANVKFSDD